MSDTITIRDLRESKQLSQDAVASAAGVTYSVFVRIEEGAGKTTPDEVARVLEVLQGMEPGKRKLAGRPFKDPAKQAAVKAAREAGQPVSAVLGVRVPVVAEPIEGEAAAETPKRTRKGRDGVAAALAKKTPARSRKPKATPDDAVPADSSAQVVEDVEQPA